MTELDHLTAEDIAQMEAELAEQNGEPPPPPPASRHDRRAGMARLRRAYRKAGRILQGKDKKPTYKQRPRRNR